MKNFDPKYSFSAKTPSINLYHNLNLKYLNLSQSIESFKTTKFTKLTRNIPLSNNAKLLIFTGVAFYSTIQGIELIR